MKYIFTSVGGSGSSALMDLLNKHYQVDSKPDTFFVEKGQPYTEKGGIHQILGDYGLQEYPRKETAQAFEERTSYAMDTNNTIENNLLYYLTNIKLNRKRTVLFNSLYKFNFFSRNDISNVVCLTRHPVCAYLSYVKPERHKNLIKGYGGPEAKESIHYFARNWKANVEEALRLTDNDSHILRYEYLAEDVPNDLLFLADDWNPNFSYRKYINKYIDNEMFLQTKDVYFEVYNKW